MIDIYLENINKNFGQWVFLPLDADELEAVKKDLHYDDDEIIITAYEAPDNLKISDYDSLDRLNELADRLNRLWNWERETLGAMLEVEPGGVDTALELLDRIDDVYLLNAQNYFDLGYELLHETYDLNRVMPEHLINYIDYEAYGRDLVLNGDFTLTSKGALSRIY